METGRPSPKQAKGRDRARNPGLVLLSRAPCGCVAGTEAALTSSVVVTFLLGPWSAPHLSRESGESKGSLRQVSDGRGCGPSGYGGR